nr:hypothetical protein [Tanacetum cinerariifolium]
LDAIVLYTHWVDMQKEIACLMLASMTLELQNNMEDFTANDMLKELKTMFSQLTGMSKNHVSLELGLSLILTSLSKDYDGFKDPKKNKKLHDAQGKVQGKGKSKLAYAPKPKIPLPPNNEHPAKDAICYQCGEVGHWRRNYPMYIIELTKKKKKHTSGASTLSIFTIELYSFPNKS